jgi:predicted transcriptional regulator
MPRTEPSSVVTLRLPRDLDRRIEHEARRRRRTKSALLRDALERAFGDLPADDPAREARRQSLLVSGRKSERQAIEFIDAAADRRGWK